MWGNHLRRRLRPGSCAVASVLLASLLGVPTSAQTTSPAPGDGDDRLARHDETGTVTFLGSAPGRPLRTAASPGQTPAAVAREFLGERRAQLGLVDGAAGLRVADQRSLPGGGTVVRLEQSIAGVPVLGGEFTVNLDAARDVLSVLGEASPADVVDTEPSVGQDRARSVAVRKVSRETGAPSGALRTTPPRLMVYDPRLLAAPGPLQSPRLAWVLEVRRRGPVNDLQHQVVVEADSGVVALSFSTLPTARNRQVCDAANTPLGYPCLAPGSSETDPPTAAADRDARAAFDYAGDTYDFFSTRFGRDSLDNAGLPLRATVNYCPTPLNCPYQNAFWDGSQLVYGDGFASADDVVGHELTHGVTDFTSNLFYYQQSGAINEAMSDVFGELIDLSNSGATHGSGGGTDTAAVRWQVGEDTPLGAIRDMEDPPQFDQPDRMRSHLYAADAAEEDGGGVHTNSGVANKAAYLLTDGGTFNGQVVSALGLTKTARIFHTANTTMLVSASDYGDLANALRQGCRNLAGVDGITAADCLQVDRAVLATEMDLEPASAPTATASVCPSGTTPSSTVLADDLERPHGQLTSESAGGANAWAYPQNPNAYRGFDATYAASGVTNIWGDDVDVVSDSAIRLTSAVTIPPASYLHFNHAYGFDDDPTSAWDGGVVEYSATGPSGPWMDAGALFAGPGGANGYNGVVSPSVNPLSRRPAFVRESNGYGSSRADLSGLAGQSVLFRWRIGTDAALGDYGWFLDDLRISTCAPPAGVPAGPPAAGPAALPPAPPPPVAPADTNAPQSRITKHPKRKTVLRRARFSFRADESNATFQCRLDRGRWRSCTSPRRYKVKPGKHTFRVRAVDAAGNKDARPARFGWRVQRRR